MSTKDEPISWTEIFMKGSALKNIQLCYHPDCVFPISPYIDIETSKLCNYHKLHHTNDVLYRACPIVLSDNVSIEIMIYKILKRTKCGFWINASLDTKLNPGILWCEEKGKRFVLDRGKKRFAYPTIAQAIESLVHRKRVYRDICLGKAKGAEKIRLAALKYQQLIQEKLATTKQQLER